MGIDTAKFVELKKERKLITASRAADILGYSVQNVYKLCDMGKLSGLRVSRKLYIYRQSVETYLNEQVEEF